VVKELEAFNMVTPIVAMAWAAAAAAALALVASYLRWRKKNSAIKKIVPRAMFNHFGNLKDLESFGDYVGKIVRLSNNFCTYLPRNFELMFVSVPSLASSCMLFL